MRISDIARLCDCQLFLTKDTELHALCHDSRTCTSSDAYFSFPGIHAHGDDFIQDALERGAVLIVTSHRHEELEGKVSVIVTNDSIRRLYALSSYAFFNASQNLEIIAVTGTDGKTSTSYFIWQLLNMTGHKSGLVSTVYADCGKGLEENKGCMTTPEAFTISQMMAASVNNGAKYFVLEASSHALSEEYDRLAGLTFKASCYTRISSEHLDFHKTYDRYIDSKLNLARRTAGPVFAYEDNKEIVRIRSVAGEHLVILKAPHIICQKESGIIFLYGGKEYSFPYPEDFAIENAFEAACIVSTITKTPIDCLLFRLQELRNPAGRMETVRSEKTERMLVIDFAHTPDAFKRLFSSFRKLYPDRPFTALFGAPGSRDSSKRPLLGQVAGTYCHRAILTEDDWHGENPDEIMRQCASGIDNAECEVIMIQDRRDAIRKAIEKSSENEIIFFLGIGHQKTISRDAYSVGWNEKTVAEDELRRFEKD